MILEMVIAPDERLKKMSMAVEKVDDNVRKLMDDMFETMYYNHGIGLSAVQVGVLKRVIVVDVNHGYDDSGNIINQSKFFMVNPEIIWKEQDVKPFDEGCLSFPGESVKISRPNNIKVKFLDYNGNLQEIEASGLLAVCIQHEIDHMNGISINHYLTPLRRDMMMRRLTKRKKRISG